MNKGIIKPAVVVMLALMLVPSALGAYKKNDNAAISRNMNIFNSLFKELNAFYVDTINAQTSIETAIKAMLSDVDPYTEYISAREQDDFMVVSTGEYGGIGSYITARNGSVYFSEPQIGTPAARGGIRAGDRIVRIDTLNAEGMTSSQVSARLKGTPKTQVQVSVVRPYVKDSLLTFNLTREKIKVNPVPYYGVTRDNVGYISITTFNEKTGSAVKEAVLALKANDQVKAIALDLRGNGGGLLEQAVQVVGLFVPKGTEVLQTRGRQVQDTKIYKTTAEPVDTKIPLFVLVDGGSASASEIVTGALQDLDRAVVVGARSFGKGLVQTTRQLPYDGMLKVTIAKYYIPSGRLIQEIDYSHRNADGSATRIPDSLTTVFHTAHGREVRDGGGITPDIKVSFGDVNRLTYNIVRDYWAFDFATKYCNEHDAIATPDEFEITDEIYDEFKRFIDPKRFQYDKVCETGLEQLQKVADAEGYASDSVKAEFAKLAKLLKHDLNHDLDMHRSDIAEILAREIVKRYYYEPGEVQLCTKHDDCLDRVAEVMGKPGEYERILNLAAPAQKLSADKDKGKKKK
ncbi:MAG: S41 family peptidase [Muribaculaceae bacterium]